MRTIPVDVSAFEAWLCVMLPEPRVANSDTGELRKDRETGQTMYSVGVCAIQGRNSSVIQVTVVGEPQGLTLGARFGCSTCRRHRGIGMVVPGWPGGLAVWLRFRLRRVAGLPRVPRLLRVGVRPDEIASAESRWCAGGHLGLRPGLACHVVGLRGGGAGRLARPAGHPRGRVAFLDPVAGGSSVVLVAGVRGAHSGVLDAADLGGGV